MFLLRRYGQALLRPTPRLLVRLETCRRHASSLKEEVLQPATPVAERLAETGLWHYGKAAKSKAAKEKTAKDKGGAKASTKSRPRSKAAKPKGDKNRVNIVDEKLCDDIVTYIKPTLERHVGCDLIDIYPGVGLWSNKLHEVLKPRSHILMEPDTDLYKPFLEPLLAKPGVRMVPQSGIVWTELNQVLTPEYLPRQVQHARDSPEATKRNDTLLVTANIAFHPRKRFLTFDSVAMLVLYQFITAIRTSSLFQKYGLVRMLIWAADHDKTTLLPRSVQGRRRLAIEGELTTDWITELVGSDGEVGSKSARFVRDRTIDLESARNTLDRMRENGIQIPPGRESQLVTEVLTMSSEERRAIAAGKAKAEFDRPYLRELEELEEDFAAGKFSIDSDKYKRFKDLRYALTRNARQHDAIHELLIERDEITALHRTATASGEAEVLQLLQERQTAWNDRIDKLVKNQRREFMLSRDNLDVFRQTPPVLSWDRRYAEPLRARPTEYFPNAPCCLLDIQPKAMHPLLRGTGARHGHAGDTFELILRSLLQTSLDPVGRALGAVWPGAPDGVIPHCPSLTDPDRGGQPIPGYGEVTVRGLNETQLVEMMQAWMKWPFRPTYPELVARLADDPVADAEDDGGGGALHSEFM
ncbi:rRNA adenine N(6)-methyltransferase [Pleurostoma richardsiae]|uniref:rRNA adenine N(6)-methyltransferase n=1 Tax=Pleurostoma richardsiae TaxID=41990 RepID=A0AA38VU04_9PEZI|nr:rRNA adenine N(6)-methyltransferase [Pleurostoma richardsiae]